MVRYFMLAVPRDVLLLGVVEISDFGSQYIVVEPSEGYGSFDITVWVCCYLVPFGHCQSFGGPYSLKLVVGRKVGE